MAKILVKKLDPSIELPAYKTEGASGMDLMAFIKETIVLKSKNSCLVPTGIAVAFSNEFEIQIRPRSGLAAKHQLSVLNTPGTIDADYRGEIRVILINLSNEEFTIKDGERIAQMVIAKHVKSKWQQTDKLEETKRGVDGFGSTGNK